MRPIRYRDHHAILAEQFEKKLGRLGKMDRSELFVPESTILGGFGHLIDGQLINIDTLKFYECLIAIDRAGFLDQLKSDPARKEVWLEIGAGWGGFANAVKTRFPDTTYVIVDLPQTILFSATYLLSAFPAAKMAIYPEVSAAEISRNLRDYDFVFIPHFLFPDISFDLDPCTQHGLFPGNDHRAGHQLCSAPCRDGLSAAFQPQPRSIELQ